MKRLTIIFLLFTAFSVTMFIQRQKSVLQTVQALNMPASTGKITI